MKSYLPEYRTWIDMKTRCNNINAHNYKYYGAKGVTVCSRWENSFDTFLRDMGYRPEGCTLGRKNDSGNYEPNNCQWEKKSDQSSQALRGEKNAHSKLTEEQIMCLRSLWAHKAAESKYTPTNIAADLKISRQSVNNIINYRTWTHI